MTINKYHVKITSFSRNFTYEVVASSEENAIYQVMQAEPYCPKNCITAKFIKNIYTTAKD